MKKVALCISGQLRCHQKLLIHWIERVIKPITEKYELTLFFFIARDSQFETVWPDIYKQYKSLKIKIVYRSEIDKDFSNIVPNVFLLEASGLSKGHNQLIREHYFMDSVIGLKKQYEQKNNVKFDYVIRTRFDVIPQIFDTELLNHVTSTNLCISDHDHHSYLNGRFTICTSDNADRIFTIVKNYDNIIENIEEKVVHGQYGKKKYFSGELTWQTHVSLFNDIEIKLIPYNVYLVRDFDMGLDQAGGIFLNGERVATFNRDQGIGLNII